MSNLLPLVQQPQFQCPISGIFNGGKLRFFTASGTFVVPTGVTSVRTRVWGGGGTGSLTVQSMGKYSSYTWRSGAGGGFSFGIFTGLTPGASITVTVGAAGGTSSFGSYNSATGGSTSSGGSGSGGTFNFTGGAGASFGNNQGYNNYIPGGGGAANYFGDGGPGVSSGNGLNGTSGGSGGYYTGSGVNGFGGNGFGGGGGYYFSGTNAATIKPADYVGYANLDFIGTGGGGIGSVSGVNGGGSNIAIGGFPGGGSYSAGGRGLVIVEW